MSAPPRVIYIDKFSVVDCLKDIGGDWEYILKSDYDELQAKLTAAEEKLAKIDATEPVAFMTIDKAPYLYRDANPISSDYPIEKLIIKPTKEPT